ncbi:MAG: winged helix-turn-helix transcriptional regulator [Methanobacterium sp.]|uniref:winged helix-turn-helix domain-containing protein n=1 Tax=Methanobacterium sp. TaxID=2164 RepID=UPI003D658D12|nr:winged helix-turn-helix transcriptional regulator [Methanobacterium sp.]
MLNENEDYKKEITEIKERLGNIQKDIKNLMENTNQQYIDLLLSNSKKEFITALTGYLNHDIENTLEKGMIIECELKNECKVIFKTFLQKNASLINQDNIPEEAIIENQAELNKIKSEAPFEKCKTCFNEISVLFEKQVNLMRSLCIYSTNQEKKQDISTICEETLVKHVLEPLSNRQRLQILKSMANDTKTFSSLSELTGLKGGNLLFHLQKLLDGDMILQRHERGDYMLTEKGYKLLVMLSEVNVLSGQKTD